MTEDLINEVLKSVETEGVKNADIRIENSLATTIRTVNGRVERSTTGIDAGLGLRVLKDGAWGFSFGPLEKTEDIIKMALQANRLNVKQKKEDISFLCTLEYRKTNKKKWKRTGVNAHLPKVVRTPILDVYHVAKNCRNHEGQQIFWREGELSNFLK